jgi:hypothetical protein
MSGTARFALPMLAPGQAQKELFHNEALQTLDLLVAAAVEEPPRATPPGSPTIGQTYIVAGSPTGAWAGRQNCLACYTSGGWRFVDPRDGLIALVKSTSLWAVFRSGAWELGTIRGSSLVVGGQQVVGPRSAAIVSPTGGATIDAEGRSAIALILSALRTHGLIET